MKTSNTTDANIRYTILLIASAITVLAWHIVLVSNLRNGKQLFTLVVSLIFGTIGTTSLALGGKEQEYRNYRTMSVIMLTLSAIITVITFTM